MAVDKFKFVSPGVFIDEVDESAIPELPERMGPLVVGRFQKGPAHRPVKVNSFKDFVATFGNPADGNASGDIFRSGAQKAPTYAAYAAQAWLRNNSPCTVYRILGQQHSDATANQGEAGWRTDNTPNTSLASAGGAYGLFVMPSASAATPVTGVLAAVWYVQEGAIILTGTSRTNNPLEGAGMLIEGPSGEFTAKIISGSAITDVADTIKFNFNRDSKNFIRNVFNTDPTQTNSAIVNTSADSNALKSYWLGETFEGATPAGGNSQIFSNATKITSAGANLKGVILQLDNTGASEISWHDHRKDAQAAATGWIISQDNRGSQTGSFNPAVNTDKLFKVHALGGAGNTDPGHGEASNRDIKISIADIKVSPNNFNKYATFSVLVRAANDTDNNPVILERFSSMNLNPASANYIGRVIGDRSYRYDEANKIVDFLGTFENQSKYIRVEVSPLVEGNGAEGLVPFGVIGPVIPADIAVNGATVQGTNDWVDGSGSLPNLLLAATHDSSRIIDPQGLAMDVLLTFPETRIRVSSSEGGLVQPSRAFFGYQSTVAGSRRYDPTNIDLHRGKPVNLDQHGTPSAGRKYSWIFTLDNISASSDVTGHGVHVSGSRALGNSFTATGGSVSGVLDQGFDKFTTPMFGGFDGFDITEADPLRNTLIDGTNELSSYAYNSIKKAIDITSDAEYVEFDIATIPGMTNDTLNAHLIQTCEERADALAIVDLKGNYAPPHEHAQGPNTNLGAVDGGTGVVDTLKGLNINSSYGAAFYPFVQIRDTINDSILFVPPSVVALGTMSSSQRRSAVWFAPAGFTRGGLSEGSAGLPVIGVRERLTSAKRDKLYEANINPIASFPAEGIVIFGQKTLQLTPSALDRINVRRLLIFVKKEISRIASTLLFEQNVQDTWNRFRGQAVPFLEDVQAGLGLTDFRVVLDETTTTPDLQDRNILYAKIFLKPAKAIEFIALDFIISRSGASFDD